MHSSKDNTKSTHFYSYTPEGVRDGREHCAPVAVFDVVDRCGKDDDADAEEENEEAEFAGACLHCLSEDLEALRVARQLEDAEHSEEAHDAQDCERHGAVAGVRAALLGARLVLHDGPQLDAVWQDREQVEDVHAGPEEDALSRTGHEAHEELEREPDDADGLHPKEHVRVHAFLVLVGLYALVVLIVLELRQRLDAVRADGHDDHRKRDDRRDPRAPRALRVLEEQPDALLPLVTRHRTHRLANHNALVGAVLLEHLAAQLVELELLEEHLVRHVERALENAVALVEVQDGIDAGATPVEEVLVAQRVVILEPLFRTAEQCVREAR